MEVTLGRSSQHGRRDDPGQEKVETAAQEMELIAGQKLICGQKSIAQFKLRRHADRRQGHPARADVRVSRPAGHDRAAARPDFGA
jgi:hypothetical protein